MSNAARAWIGLEHDGKGWLVKDRAGFVADIIDMPVENVPAYLEKHFGLKAKIYDWWKGDEGGSLSGNGGR